MTTGDDSGLAVHLARTRETWQQLVHHGMIEGNELALDFSFDAPSYSVALSLRSFLESDTDYHVGVSAVEDRWTVCGTTQRAAVSPSILAQWVAWLVVVGANHGASFDGWGAELP